VFQDELKKKAFSAFLQNVVNSPTAPLIVIKPLAVSLFGIWIFI
jgi:hypothetical protein